MRSFLGSFAEGAPAEGAPAAEEAPPSRQQKNVQALTAVRRVRVKLEGRDRWPGKERDARQTVSEQVEAVIKQAVAIDNLSALYEGWAAWL